ncbi:MAG: peptidoglycan-binding protein [Rhodopila sp.]
MTLRSQQRAVASLLALLVSAPLAHSQTPSQVSTTGPSFPCPVPRDPLAQLICNSPALSKLDLGFVQTYQALRQQLAESPLQPALRQESLNFGLAVRSSCGIAMAQAANARVPLPPPAPPGAEACVLQEYERQRALWRDRLSRPAAEEAARPIEQQIMIQAALQRLSFLSSADTADGIFGTATRAAIVAWQLSAGRPATGLMGDSDAQTLLQGGSTATAAIPVRPSAPPAEDPVATAPQRDTAQAELKKRFGPHADAISAGNVLLGMTEDEVYAAKGVPRRKDVFPPHHGLWVYDTCRVAYTDGRGSHVGR